MHYSLETFFNDVVTFFSVFDYHPFIILVSIIFISFPIRFLRHFFNCHSSDFSFHSSSESLDDVVDVDEDLKKYYDYKF